MKKVAVARDRLFLQLLLSVPVMKIWTIRFVDLRQSYTCSSPLLAITAIRTKDSYIFRRQLHVVVSTDFDEIFSTYNT